MDGGMKTNPVQWRAMKTNFLWAGRVSKSKICKMSPF